MAAEPFADAVNIPFEELTQRTHELPPRDEIVRVVGPPALAAQAAAWLTAHGRRAAVEARTALGAASDEPAIGRLWEPAAFLADVLPQLRPGAALDLACGSGRDAVFLAAGGWQITAVDVLPDALERARDLSRRCAAAIEPITWLQADLERQPPAYGPVFDLIVGFRYLHRPLLARLDEWLKPGGSVIWETFTTLHRARHGRPADDARIVQPGELPALLPRLRVRHHAEEWHGDVHTARIWASRA